MPILEKPERPLTELLAITHIVRLMEEAKSVISRLEDPEARKRVSAYADMFAGDIGSWFYDE